MEAYAALQSEEILGYNVQFIVATEFEQQAVRYTWLKFLSQMNCRSVSVIPILRVSNSLAKRSSRFVKRCFDVVVASLLLFLAPVFGLLCYSAIW